MPLVVCVHSLLEIIKIQHHTYDEQADKCLALMTQPEVGSRQECGIQKVECILLVDSESMQCGLNECSTSNHRIQIVIVNKFKSRALDCKTPF